MNDTPSTHDLVEATEFADLPQRRHVCVRCGAERVGHAPPLPCPAPPQEDPRP